jgi:DNA-directed RNA polymerase specialized sigma24 family protein
MKPKNLIVLIKVWDEKLKRSGFKDIENRKSGQLKHIGGDINWGTVDKFEAPTSVERGYTTLAWKESQAEYFRLCGQLLHEYEFKNIFERIVWQLHAEGFSYQEIANVMNCPFRKIRYCIEKLSKDMGLKPFNKSKFFAP